MEHGAALQTVRHQAHTQGADGEHLLEMEEEHSPETESDVPEERGGGQ